MFKKLLNVGKGHLSDKSQQQQQQHKDLFQLNEIRSYGFSHLSCLGYSASLSLIAVGSKLGLLRVLGTPSVEFSHQLEATNHAIRQIELIDCRYLQTQTQTSAAVGVTAEQQDNSNVTTTTTPAKIVCVTDNGQLHLLEFKTVKHYQQPATNTTSTDTHHDVDTNDHNYTQTTNDATNDDVQLSNNNNNNEGGLQFSEYTRLEKVATLEYFANDEYKSRRVTTIEVSLDSRFVYVGTVGGAVYQVSLDNFADPPPQLPSSSTNVDQSADESSNEQQLQVDNRTSDTASKKSKKQSSQSKQQQQKDNADEVQAANDDDATEVAAPPEEPVRPDNELEKSAIYYDELVAPALPDEIKTKKSGPVEAIKRHPMDGNKVLIAYQRGLSVVFDTHKHQVDRYFYNDQSLLESATWADPYGEYFYTAHNDGSYVRWHAKSGTSGSGKLAPNNDDISQVFGPYPSKPIMKIGACKAMSGDQLEDLVIFSGGMPRASYDDKNPVTIVRVNGDNTGSHGDSLASTTLGSNDTIKQVLDFTSKVLDFAIITRPRGLDTHHHNLSSGGGGGAVGGTRQQPRNQVAIALAVLAEEEFVVIDLLHNSASTQSQTTNQQQQDSYLEFALPYLNCVHSSAITCNQHYSDISGELYEQICTYNQRQLRGKFSPNEWPIQGGKIVELATECKHTHDILLTGHEDGSVHFWDVSGLSMKHLLHLTTSKYFVCSDDDDAAGADPIHPIDGDEHQQQQEAHGINGTSNADNQETTPGWPPMKRVGQFDPYSDDARLAIRKFALCPKTGNLVVVGTAGQVLVFELKDESCEKLIQVNEVQLITANDEPFVWKGHSKLNVRSGNVKFDAGYHLVSFVQLSPPAMVTALDARPDWALVAAGTSHGFVLFDYVNQTPVVTKCTLNAHDFALVKGGDDASGTAISRRKSFRKSLRESFRRLRKGRSQRAAAPTGSAVGANNQAPAAPQSAFGGRRILNSRPSGNATAPNTVAASVVAGAGGERSVDARVELNSIVRCVSLTPAIISAQANGRASATLWVGTQAGLVLVYAINLHPKPSAQLAKEIQLKHKAPVIAMFVTPANLPVEYPPAPSINSTSITATSTAATDTTPSDPVSNQTATDNQTDAVHVTGQDNTESKITPAALTDTNTPDVNPKTQTDHKHTGYSEQARVLICSEEQFKVFNLPNLKPFCKFKLTAHEGLRAKKINITQLVRPGQQQQVSVSKSVKSLATQTNITNEFSAEPNGRAVSPTSLSASINNNNNNNNNTVASANLKQQHQVHKKDQHKEKEQPDNSNANHAVEVPYMVCMSNQGDCAIYSVPDLKRQAQIQVCKREDINGITSTVLTQYGEGFYLRSTSDFLRFSISSQRVMRCLSVV